MVPADSRRIPRVPRYSGYRYASSDFEYRTVTVYGPIFQTVLLVRFLALTGVFSLTGWSRQIRAGFLVSRVTQDTAMLHFASHTGLSPSMVTFSKVVCSRFAYNVAVLQPR